jgi:hypothetical protein
VINAICHMPRMNTIFRTVFSFKVCVLCDCIANIHEGDLRTARYIALFICHCVNIQIQIQTAET